MSFCVQTDIISFQHSGASVRYDGTFNSPSNKYNVALSLKNTDKAHSKKALNFLKNRKIAAEQFNLSIYWMKISKKFISVKVYEVDTERILFEKNSTMPFLSKRYTSLVTVLKIPAIYVISITTCLDTDKLVSVVPLLGFAESDCDKKELLQLSKDIKNLLETNPLSDVIMTDGGNKLHLHKVILSARSSVFEKMFQCDMKENLEGLITIEDISFDVLKVLVNYMYSGELKIESRSMARELYSAADKYDLQNVKKICLSKLKPMRINDVFDNLILADMYGETALKEKALHFIVSSYFSPKSLECWIKFRRENQVLTIEKALRLIASSYLILYSHECWCKFRRENQGLTIEIANLIIENLNSKTQKR